MPFFPATSAPSARINRRQNPNKSFAAGLNLAPDSRLTFRRKTAQNTFAFKLGTLQPNPVSISLIPLSDSIFISRQFVAYFGPSDASVFGLLSTSEIN
jgi:hypothetical protein